MNRDKEFNNILDECLERVLTTGETVEKCLKSYPLIASELEPLLRTALIAKEASDIKPSFNFKQRARNQFQAAIREKTEIRVRRTFRLQSRWVTAAVAVLALLVVSSGTVAAANNSMPDQRLYPVKLATEAVQITLTPSTVGKAELYVKLSDRRVAEIIAMADEGKTDQVEKTTEKLSTYLTRAANLQIDLGQAEPTTTYNSSDAEESQTAPLASAPPTTIPPFSAQSIAPTITPVPSPTRLSPPGISESPSTTGGKNQVVTGENPTGNSRSMNDSKEKDNQQENAVNSKQAKLKEILSRNAASNDEALKAVLERAPESVKPALKQAINVADAGYEKALNNLK